MERYIKTVSISGGRSATSHWKTIQKSFGTNLCSLKRHSPKPNKQSPKEMIKRIETSLIKTALELELWNLPPEERLQHLTAFLDLERLTDEEMIKYIHEN